MSKIVAVLLFTIGLQAQPSYPLYRIWRITDESIYPYPNEGYQDVPLTEWTCDTPAADPAVNTARMADPARPGRECVWAIPDSAPLRTQAKPGTAYRYRLAVKPSEYEVWSDMVGDASQPAPVRVRILP